MNVIDKWKKALREAISDEKKNRAKMLVDASNIMFFFMFKEHPYGAPESSRVTYAKMKDPNDEDHSPSWLKEASFSAMNLIKCLDGEQNQTVFTNKELKDIKVVDKEEVTKLLNKHIGKDD